MAKKKTKVTSPNVAVLFAKGTAQGVRKAAEHVLKESNRNLPILDRDLLQSGRVTYDEDTAAVTYDAPHALKQHEDQRLEHPNGGSAKYLENAFNSEKKAILEILAREMREELQ